MTGAEVIIPAILGTTGAAAGTTALTAAELAAALSATGGVAAGTGGALGTAALTGAELGGALSTAGGVAAGSGGALGSASLTGAELGGALSANSALAATAVPEASFGAKALTTAKALAKEAVVPLVGAAATSALTPKVDIPKPNAPPTIDQAKLAQEAADRQRRRRGGAANILTGKLGDPSRNQTAAKTLLGS